MTNVNTFIMNTLRQWPNNEVTHRDLIAWFVTTTGKQPDFQLFHVRDALYRLENKGLVERYKGPNDRGFYWRLNLKGDDPVLGLTVH